MEIRIECEVPEGGDYVCLLLKTLYGLKQASKTWFEYFRDTLVLSGDEGCHNFRESMIDPCIFYNLSVHFLFSLMSFFLQRCTISTVKFTKKKT
jgi:hypothetical protein